MFSNTLILATIIIVTLVYQYLWLLLHVFDFVHWLLLHAPLLRSATHWTPACNNMYGACDQL